MGNYNAICRGWQAVLCVFPPFNRRDATTPVVVTVRESRGDEMLTADEITARLNEIYCDNPAVIDEDIQLAQYNLVGDEDW